MIPSNYLTFYNNFIRFSGYQLMLCSNYCKSLLDNVTKLLQNFIQFFHGASEAP